MKSRLFLLCQFEIRTNRDIVGIDNMTADNPENRTNQINDVEPKELSPISCSIAHEVGSGYKTKIAYKL